MNIFRFAARALRREFRHGELRTLAAALVLAVAALTAVATLGQRVERAIVASAAELIGGDLGVSARREIAPEFSAEAQRLNLQQNRSAEFPSVVFADGKSQLAQVSATDASYPLRGVLRIRGSDGSERDVNAPGPGQAYADGLLINALGLKLGDSLELAGKPLTIAGEILRQPDGGQMFSLAPRLIVALDDAQSSGLLGVGSRARHKLMLAGDAAALAQFQAFAKANLKDGAQLVTVAEAQQNLRTAFERGESFLRLAALLSALLSGIAVALAAQRYARRKIDEVALLRALGLGKHRVLASLSLTVLMLGLPACLTGAGIGLLLQQIVLNYAGNLLPAAAPATSLLPALAAIAVGLAVLVGFALPPLARLRDVPPMRVFQRAVGLRPRRFDLLYLLPPAVAFGLIMTQSGNSTIASALAGSLLGVTAATVCAGLLLIVLLRRLGRSLPGALRFGLANLARRRGLSLIQATALALSFTALLLLAVVGPGLLAAWRADLPPQTPNHFLLNLQTEQRTSVETQLQNLGAKNLNVLPLAVGKLVAINGKAPRAEDYEDRRAAGWINGETRLSWSPALPESNVLKGGAWFDGKATAPQISVEQMWIDMLGLKLGDTLSFTIGDRRIDAQISSIRQVDWTSFRVNFFVLLDPATAAELPHSLIASYWLPAERTVELRSISRQFPNLSMIDINAILDRVRDIIDRVSSAVMAVLGFSLLAGLLVLIAALNVSAEERRFETALLRTLGAKRGQLLSTVLGEFALLGLIAGLIAALGAISAGLSLGRGVFRIAWHPPLLSFAIGVVAAVALVTFAGWLGTRRIARTSPVLVLRKE
ncbi:putative ABC transport system permease protein [Tahibacter aquaticus]|uniref:Putative ABC transport system permease protein n=1 Tax=Tahibacter aquaticus TaxID=520092 RepID=A0A4R6YTW5_9GAMM|nr:FtsX-like permease family protein [Tahibacter aquaticus]TDR41685.1 putative ABC transport system permease protein [Tahibacter aquaticus]